MVDIVNMTLEQIEKEYWGAPEYPSYLVTTCHQLRQKPLREFTIEDLRIMIGQQFSLPTLVPMALECLKDKPLAEGDFFPGDLLKAMVQLDEDWHGANPDWTLQLVAIAKRAVYLMQNDPEAFPDDTFKQEMVDLLTTFTCTYED